MNRPKTTVTEPWRRQLVDACYGIINPDIQYRAQAYDLAYPGGDVPADTGVCTDVIIRTYRHAFGYDLQQHMHEDIVGHPDLYSLHTPNPSLDHRRVRHQVQFLRRHATEHTAHLQAQAYQPGDIVVWKWWHKWHIGIIIDVTSPITGNPLVLHNAGWGQMVDDFLFQRLPTAHFSFDPTQL